MRITTKFMLALAFVGSLAVTSCKDYDEDNYNNALVGAASVTEALEKQVKEMQAAIEELKQRKECECDPNGGGSLTINNFTTLMNEYLTLQGGGSTGGGNTGGLTQFVENKLGDYVKLQEYNQKITELENLIGESVKADDLQSKVEAIIKNDQTITTLQGDLTTLKDRVSVLETNLGNQTAKIGRMETDIANNKTELEALRTLVESIGHPGVDLSNYMTRDDVKTLLNDYLNKEAIEAKYATLEKLASDVDSVRKVANAYTDQQIALVNAELAKKADKSDLEGLAKQTTVDDLATELRAADAAMKTEIDALETRVSTLEGQVSDMLVRLGKLEDARAKQVTGIIIQQVKNPAFGSYNSLISNVKTNMLVAYFGKAATTITFPSCDEDNAEYFFEGETLLGGEGNAGTMYLTINPNDVDFAGFKGLKLVNSQDEECAVKLGALQKTDDVLTFGFSRAADNGFYKASATISAADVNNSNVHLDIDKGQLVQALKSLIQVRNASGAKVALTDVANVAMDVVKAMKLDAQGVKVAWTDAYGEHSVVSNYDVAAVALQPLGFNTVDGIFAENGAYWKAYDKLQPAVEKAAKKVGKKITASLEAQFKLGQLRADLKDLKAQVNHIDPISTSVGEVKFNTTVTIPEFKVPVDPVKVVVPIEDFSQTLSGLSADVWVDVPIDATFDKSTQEVILLWDKQKYTVTIPDQTVVVPGKKYEVVVNIGEVTVPSQTVTVPVDMTEEVNDMFAGIIGDVNNNFDDVNKLMDALHAMLDDANDMLDAINRLEAKIENPTAYVQRVFNYIDKLANAAAKATPKLFKPTLLVNSDEGFGLAGFAGAPSTVSGNVTVYPTTFSAELLAPIFKKYIRVNGVDGVITEEKSLDITSMLKPGLNTIEFYALDYQGNEYANTYQVYRK